ncbi:dual specificity protein kinase splA-like [Drosophila navojoa]|nr:dual specificity protein kinase splA-like [Drosophila navojoa]
MSSQLVKPQPQQAGQAGQATQLQQLQHLQQFANAAIKTLLPTPQLAPPQPQQQQPPTASSAYVPKSNGSAYHKSYAHYNNGNNFNNFNSYNNYSGGYTANNNNGSTFFANNSMSNPSNYNNYNSYNGNNGNNNRQWDGSFFGQRRRISIKDFVPIQAYRPKKTQRPADGEAAAAPAQAEQALDKCAKANKSAALDDPPKENTAANSQPTITVAVDPTGDEASSELMRTLKINPSGAGASGGGAANEEEPVVPKPKVVRKPRIPRIGAKFDLEYIMP